MTLRTHFLLLELNKERIEVFDTTYSHIIPITINSLSILLVKTAHFLVINFVKGTAIKELTSFG